MPIFSSSPHGWARQSVEWELVQRRTEETSDVVLLDELLAVLDADKWPQEPGDLFDKSAVRSELLSRRQTALLAERGSVPHSPPQQAALNSDASAREGDRGRDLKPLERFEVGLLCAVTSRFYGMGFVSKVASELQLKEDSIYDAILVSQLWSRDEFAALMAQTGPFGFRLSFSHFVAAARWLRRQGPWRASYAKKSVVRALQERLAVRELRKALNSPR